jgi:glycerol-3-phosphate dehydrogenase
MKRALDRLSDESFDLLVVGGGIFGACLARDAAQRGLRVALVEKGDFCGASSANSFRMVHGGIRYLQHLDVARVRHSMREREVLLRIAPHLVKPLPIAMPTYGHGMKGKAALRAGFGLYDLITADRNRRLPDRSRRIPRGSFLSRAETLEMFPGLNDQGLTGAGVFHDGQMEHPVRLGLAFLRSAAAEGAALTNYAEASMLLRHGDRVIGARVRDLESGRELDVRAQATVVAAGAWTEPLVARAVGALPADPATFSRDLCLLTDIPASGSCGLAVLGDTGDPDAIFSRKKRHLLVIPWRERIILGVWHRVYRKSPDDLEVSESEIAAFVDEMDRAYPGLELRREQVVGYNTGLVLFGENAEGATNLRYGHRSRLRDHRSDGVDGLLSLIGVRYTTARGDAETALDLVVSRLDRRFARCRTHDAAVWGGDFPGVAALEDEIRRAAPSLPARVVGSLRRAHGSRYTDVLVAAESGDRLLREPLGSTAVLGAEVALAVRHEMALHLEDVVMRRTDLGFLGTADVEAVETASRIMAHELGWSEAQRSEEVRAALARVPGPGSLLASA